MSALNWFSAGWGVGFLMGLVAGAWVLYERVRRAVKARDALARALNDIEEALLVDELILSGGHDDGAE